LVFKKSDPAVLPAAAAAVRQAASVSIRTEPAGHVLLPQEETYAPVGSAQFAPRVGALVSPTLVGEGVGERVGAGVGASVGAAVVTAAHSSW